MTKHTVIPQYAIEEDYENHLVKLTMAIAPDVNISLVFVSVEQMLTVFTDCIESAAKIWPDNELIKEYKEK